MRIDPRRLRPSELARLLNSTPLGEVITERELHRQRISAGLQLAADGDPGRIDLFRFVGWARAMADERKKKPTRSAAAKAPPSPPSPAGDAYEAHKERARARSRKLSESGRNIGELPPVADPKRREACRLSLRRYCETYFAKDFKLAWSEDHLRLIAQMESCVLHGGLSAIGMPRGSGKTTLCEAACAWALSYGHRRFIPVIAADDNKARKIIRNVKTAFEDNALVAADFPEICYPIECLAGINQRAAGQLFNGEQTHITWTDNEIMLPTMPGSKASGAVMMAAGITGAVRGMKIKTPDGDQLRPDMVLIDDPQTRESANSPSQCDTREQVIVSDVLGLAGPGEKIAAFATVTVVRSDDMADRLLNQDRNPEWQGVRAKMVYAWPTDTKLWDQYAEIRAEELRAKRGIAKATAFYKAHRAAMDAGAKVYWEARFNKDEISAVQHAMNLRLRNEAGFFAEYQNEPLTESDGETSTEIGPDSVLHAHRCCGVDRLVLPLPVTHVCGCVDVQKRALFYLLLGITDDMTAWVIDYGTEPDQGADYYTKRSLRHTLADSMSTAGIDAQIYAGLRRLMTRLGSRVYSREGGDEMALERCLVDANWGSTSNIVYQAIRESEHRGIFTPHHGQGYGAAKQPISMRKRVPGERVGLNWFQPVSAGRRSIRHVIYDTNFWKSFAAARILTGVGDPGSLRIFGDKPVRHRLLADHWMAERAIRTRGQGREVDEWRLRQPGLDNEYWDCLVGAYVAASMLGCELRNPIDQSGAPRRARRLTIAEQQARLKRA